MKTRPIDILLMVGLFLVGAAILWTLFTLGNDRGRPATPDDAPPPASTAPVDPESTPDVEPVPLDELDGSGDGADADTGGRRDAADAPTREGAGDAGDAADAGRDDAGGSAAEDGDAVAREPIEEGQPVPLERVGFSFATGGPGACGVTLEPWEHVAVSRDLLAIYGCGTEVTIELADEIAGRTEVTVVVADTMGGDVMRTANLYVGEDEPAFEYGVTEGTLIP